MRKTIFLLFIFVTLLFASNPCESKLFTIKSAPGIKLKELIDNISEQCSLTVLIKDKYAQKKLYKRMGRLNVSHMDLREILDLLLNEEGLSYTLENNILKIRYLITKTFHIDYITTKRLGESITDASVDVGGTSTAGGTTTSKTRDVNKISSTDEFDFWKNIQEELFQITNRPDDEYKSKKPVINPNAGLVTITATKKQIKRVEKYIKTIEERLHKEVLIDVSILAVFLNKNLTTGIDWSQFNLQTDYIANYQRIGIGEYFHNLQNTSTATTIIDATLNMSGIIKFLQKNGDVITLSNPKILTLNNQPAIITIGDTINYNVPTSITINSNSNLGEKAYTPSSIFVGILLNITPEITDDGNIILRINPSISELKNPEELNKNLNGSFREIAPDTKEKKISSVVKVKDGSTLILGGLISNTKNFAINGVPLLKDIPIFGHLFKSRKTDHQRFELVFILKPKIIKNSTTKDYSLKDLGYQKLK